MAKRASPMTDPLRKALTESGMTFLELERATGVERASIMRFVTGKQSLRLDKADQLAAFLGLELRAKAK
jgi:transcriptional regulator with XRE-family HTH domain